MTEGRENEHLTDPDKWYLSMTAECTWAIFDGWEGIYGSCENYG